MNEEQVKSLIRSVISAFGGIVAGFFAAKGWFTVDQVLNVLNSGTFVGVIASIIVAVWGLFVHKEANAVAVVAAIAENPSSPVQGVVTTATPEGKALADSIPGPTVAAAGTAQASAIAGK